MNKKPMVILTGPTAVGKTALSIALAKRINGAVISADSMQVYRHMDIGSAKIMPKEMQGVKHYLVDALEPGDEFHVVRFVEMAKTALTEIYEAGKIPIIVGGTGFYIQALLYDVDFTEQECDEAYRASLAKLAEERGNRYLHEMLREIDPASAEAIHENNRKRVIRALEFYHHKLYQRIDARVDAMLGQGLVAEVTKLKEMGCHGGMVSMQGLGYKEILEYLAGESTLDEAVYIIKRETRHFAKRQLTWFRREREVIWLNKPEYQYDEEKILEKILAVLSEKEILPS